MHAKQDTWCSREFEPIQFDDDRLNQRFIKVSGDLLNSPSKPIHAAVLIAGPRQEVLIDCFTINIILII